MSDISLVGIVEAQLIFEKWIDGCIANEPLEVLNQIVPDYFNKRRYPTETDNTIFVAQESLFSAIQSQITSINKLV